MQTTDLITLPDADTMLRLLRDVSAEDHLCEKFYPKLLRHAGETKHRSAIPLMVELALYDYLEGLPPQMGAIMRISVVPGVIEALSGATDPA